MTATHQNFVEDGPARLERTCRRVVDGRRAARALADWLRRFDLSEPEFQVVWCLRDLSVGGVDQTTLAQRLALSPAQVSATVERLGTQGWIAPHARPDDRRRRLWHLSASGQALIDTLLCQAGSLVCDPTEQASASGILIRREAAA